MDRLQKILSHAGIASRRAAERLIAEGRVTVNGKAVLEMGTKADPARDDIRVDGRRVKGPERLRYILLYKPTGYVTTRSDPQRRRTVMDLIAGVREYVYPVGRLDYDTEGLLLLTNDGDLAAMLTHPRHEVERTYEAHVAGMPGEDAIDRLRRGIPLDGRRTAPATSSCSTGGRTTVRDCCSSRSARAATGRCAACWRRWDIPCARCGARRSGRSAIVTSDRVNGGTCRRKSWPRCSMSKPPLHHPDQDRHQRRQAHAPPADDVASRSARRPGPR